VEYVLAERHIGLDWLNSNICDVTKEEAEAEEEEEEEKMMMMMMMFLQFCLVLRSVLMD